MELMETYDTTDEETDDVAAEIPQLQLTVLQPAPSKTCPHGLVRYIDPCAQCWRRLQDEARLWVIRPEGELCEHDLLNCEVCDWRRLCKGCGAEFVRRPGRTCGRCVAQMQQPKVQAQAQQGLFLDLVMPEPLQDDIADSRYQL